IENLMVDYFGTSMPLNQLANISVPEARLLAIQPWDKQAISLVEKTILQANLGLNPSNDGTLIRIPIPPLTDERRQELVKMVHKRVEEGRVSIRNARRDSMDQARTLKKEKEISEDEERRAEERLQKLTDNYVRRVNDVGAAKEKELIET
ncbi:MAG: ribosome recycling factor, partial [Dehalococcoidia bacterium]